MVNLVTKLLLIGLVLIGSTAVATAQQPITPEKRALIKELLEVTGEPKTSETTLSAVMKQYEIEIPKMINERIKSDQRLSSEDKEKMLKDMDKDVPQMVKRYIDLFLQRINISQFIEEAFYPLYDKYFTENEIRDMIAFYKTETGKKTIAVSPALAAESISRGTDYLLPIMKQIETEMRQDIEQYVKGKSNSAKKKPSKS
jgi:uncharacterized protein